MKFPKKNYLNAILNIAKLFTKMIVFIWFLLFVFVLWNEWFTSDYRLMRGNLKDIIDADGNYAQTPENYAQKIFTTDTFLNEKINPLIGYYYIGGLSTNDLFIAPIIMKYKSWLPYKGWILNIGGGVTWLCNIDKKRRKELLKEPWKFIEDKFQSPEEYMSFTNRLRLYKVSKTGSELITPKANQ